MSPPARIAPHVVDAIRAASVLSDVVGRDVALKRNGRDHGGLCPFHREKTPSFTVNDAKGFYHCFGCGAHGDVFRWLMETQGLSFPEAVAAAGRLTGIDAGTDPLAALDARARAERLAALETRKGALAVLRALHDAAETKQDLDAARKIWAAAEDKPDTALAYLRGRGVTLAGGLPRIMRAHRAMYHRPSGQTWPGIVTLLEGPYGVSGVHRTFLSAAGDGKAPVESAKMTLGPVFEAGAAARLQSIREDGRLALCEGLENTLIFAQAVHRGHRAGQMDFWPVWSVLALTGFDHVALPAADREGGVRQVMLVPDADENVERKDGRPSGRERARETIERAAARLQAEGREVWVFPTWEGHDIDSMRRAAEAMAEEPA